MHLLTLLTTLAENAHYRIQISSLLETQSSSIQDAFKTNKNSLIRNFIAGQNASFPDRDKVVKIDREKNRL